MTEVINVIVDLGLLVMLLASALMIVRSLSLVSVAVLSGIYSFALCALFVIMDAVDVAFTEAAVGAGISTVLILAVIRPGDEPKTIASWPSPSAILIGLVTGLLLIYGTLDMPWYGDPGAPIHHHLAPRFLGQSGSEIGIPNVVTSVLASYRGYDTLGEVVVIFTAGCAVLILLAGGVSSGARTSSENGERSLINYLILKVVLVRIIPLVILFALYVQFHGDYGPGGGFQAGVIFGAGLITYGLLSGSRNMLGVISEKWVITGMASGVLIYGLVGVAAMLSGGEFLNYSVLAESPTTGQHIGILLIELGVGVTVAFTMISLFVSFNREEG
jgi:multicomponent Na+:H+ antiporter subunit B